MRRPLEKTSREGVSVKFFPSEKNGKSIVTAKLYDTNGVKIIGAQASVTVGNGIDKDMAKVYARNRALKKLDAMRRPDGPETTTEECSIERAFRDITDKLSLAPPEMKSRETREAAIVYFENNVLPLLRKMTANSFAPGYVRVMMFDAMLHRKKYTAVYVERGLDQMILDFAEYVPVQLENRFIGVDLGTAFANAIDEIRAEDRFRSLLENSIKLYGIPRVCDMLSEKLEQDIVFCGAIVAKDSVRMKDRLLYNLRIISSNESQTKYQTNVKIREANMILESLRRETAYRLPIIVIPEFEVGFVQQRELVRELPWKQRSRFGILALERSDTTSYGPSAPVMLDTGVRIEELCGIKIGDILFLDHGATGAINYKPSGEDRINELKNKYSHRQIFFSTYSKEAVIRRIRMLHKMRLNENEVWEAYLISDPADPKKPANTQAVADYIKALLIECGVDNAYWDAVHEAMEKEPDIDWWGRRENCDVAYGLRRNATSMMTNVARMPPGLVDAIQGRKLTRGQEHWASFITHDDEWPGILKMLERIVYDPVYTGNPGFSPIIPTEKRVDERIAFPAFSIRAAAAKRLRLTLRTVGNGPVFLDMPNGVSVATEAIQPVMNTSGPCVPIRQVVDADNFAEIKRAVIEKEEMS